MHWHDTQELYLRLKSRSQHYVSKVLFKVDVAEIGIESTNHSATVGDTGNLSPFSLERTDNLFWNIKIVPND